ncbi:MAG: response regulator [Calditrichaeota bacterium]|nr:response regulator [Calditrichota bacterium]
MLGNRKILLIDDNPEIHMMMRIILRQNGYQLFSAYNGEEGLTKITEVNPDVIILDYMMPKISGEQVFETFITDEKYANYQHIPVLMLTARTENRLRRQEFLEKGLYGYLTKPFGMRELVEIIDSTLQKARDFRQQRNLFKVTKEAKDFLEDLVESIPDAIFIVNQEFKITYFKRCFSGILGLSEKDVLGKDFRQLVHNDSLRSVSDLLEGKKEKNQMVEVVLKTATGEGVPFYITITQMKNENQKKIGSLIVATDISDLKKLQEKIIQQEKAAMFMETAVAVNHEINNPLAPILGNAQLLLKDKDKLDAVSVKRLKAIERNAHRIFEITQKLRKIKDPVSTEYLGETKMLDLKESLK